MSPLNILSSQNDTPHTNPSLDRAIILSITLSRFGLKQTVSSEDESILIKEIQPDEENKEARTVDRQLLHISKDILDAPELKRIVNHDRKIIDYIRSKSVPCPILKNGMYMLIIDNVEDLENGLQPLLDERLALIDEACDVYPQRIDEIKNRLGPLYDPGDYPSASTVKAAYDVKINYVSFSVPWKLERVSKAIFDRERDKAVEGWATVLEQSQQLLCTQMAQFVDHMVDSLSPTEDGKEKTIRKPFLEKLDQFLNNFSGRNVTSNAELQDLVTRARNVMSGVDSTALKGNQSTRDHLRSAFSEIKQSLDGMITDKPERRITLRKKAVGE